MLALKTCFKIELMSLSFAWSSWLQHLRHTVSEKSPILTSSRGGFYILAGIRMWLWCHHGYGNSYRACNQRTINKIFIYWAYLSRKEHNDKSHHPCLNLHTFNFSLNVTQLFLMGWTAREQSMSMSKTTCCLVRMPPATQMNWAGSGDNTSSTIYLLFSSQWTQVGKLYRLLCKLKRKTSGKNAESWI